jgi:AraC-like DNA-binding protein
MSSLEAAIRGGAIALLVLMAVLSFRTARLMPARLLSGLFALGAASFVLTSAPEFAYRHALWLLPFRLASMGTSVTFWLWSCAIFDDAFRPSWRHGAIWLGVVALGLGCLVARDGRLDVLPNLVSLGFIALGVWEAVAGRRADLVEGRRRFRLFLGLGAAAYAGLIVVAELFWRDVLSAAPASLANAGGMAAMAFLFAVSGLGIGGSAWSAEAVPDSVDAAPAPSLATAGGGVSPDFRDAPALSALARLMEVERAYREPGLSVATLAERLGIPEYRLRRLINGELGHRNFSSFVNSYRLDEAKSALADPAQTEVPILTIALDAGFQSIGPFNRAFKAATGTTPTEYRRVRLNGFSSSDAGAPRRI